MAGILEPTNGEIINHCKSASMLSIGVGFVTQLTGRENAILSGILLGFTKKEVDSQLDKICDFSELGNAFDDFLSTYSSGMRARLGFSVAAMLEPELLLIDEVLSVGDERFVKKAMALMEAKFSSDKTVVLVSHTMEHVCQLCNRAVWIDNGKCQMIGETNEVVAAYLNHSS